MLLGPAKRDKTTTTMMEATVGSTNERTKERRKEGRKESRRVCLVIVGELFALDEFLNAFTFLFEAFTEFSQNKVSTRFL